jgi:hypothetical protein
LTKQSILGGKPQLTWAEAEAANRAKEEINVGMSILFLIADCFLKEILSRTTIYDE